MQVAIWYSISTWARHPSLSEDARTYLRDALSSSTEIVEAEDTQRKESKRDRVLEHDALTTHRAQDNPTDLLAARHWICRKIARKHKKACFSACAHFWPGPRLCP